MEVVIECVSPCVVIYSKKLGKIGKGNLEISYINDNFNTEISYSLKNKTIEIVEHRVEKI